MKLLYLLLPFIVLVSADDHSSTDDDSDHTSTIQISSSTHHPETEHASTVQATTSTHHPETEDHPSTVYASTSTHHPDTEHTSTSSASTQLSGSSQASSPLSTFSNGIMTTIIGPSSTGVVCQPLPGFTGSPSLTTFCPILSAHPGDTGMMGGGGMMGYGYQCPDFDGSGFHYTMNMMGSNPMCCTASATLTRVGFSMGCCPCGSVCTGSIPGAQNWYTAAGQVVLTTGAVPSTATATAAATVTVVEGQAGSSLLHGSGCLNTVSLLFGSVILVVLMGCELFS